LLLNSKALLVAFIVLITKSVQVSLEENWKGVWNRIIGGLERGVNHPGQSSQKHSHRDIQWTSIQGVS